jgi:hypothetical protein
MLLSDLPLYKTRISTPCDIVDRKTGVADRVEVEVEIGIPIDAGRKLPYGARFGNVWPVSRLVYGPGHGYDTIPEVEYLRSGNDFLAPAHVIGKQHLDHPSVAFGSSGLVLRSYRALKDWAELVDEPNIDLDWKRPHATTGERFPFHPSKSSPVAIDDAFKLRYSFDDSFVARLRKSVRENFVMRPGGIWMRMPLPVWRIVKGSIGLDPFPRGVSAQTTSFALDRLADVEALLGATAGRRAEAAIAAREASILHLDPDIPNGGRDDLDVLCRTDVSDAATAAARLVPALDRATVDVWHALVNTPASCDLDSRRDAALAFISLAHGVAASEPSGERDEWLERHGTLTYRLQALELPRTGHGDALVAAPRPA